MVVTQITTREVGSVQRNDMDVVTSGQAVITKLVAGTGISLSSTGADAGTGDVTVNVAVVSGRVPFGNTSGVMATSANFLWDDSTNTFSVTGTEPLML